jgi:nitronate monooxygenase
MLQRLKLSGKEVYPLIEGGKGISITNGECSGAWANSGGVGTFSGVNADSYDDSGNIIKQIYKGITRKERHEELIKYGIEGALSQAKIARDVSPNGCIHMNILWEMGGAEAILKGVLERAKGIINGITCGAGLPYRLAEIASKFSVYYYPIVSSARAFNILWKRSYSKVQEWLGGVVYEDPWKAGGHNGLSNSEDPNIPQDPYPRVLELRKIMSGFGLCHVPIIIAGSVWCLSEWSHFIDNKEIGPVAFQFGTRPLVTQESPISLEWKNNLLRMKRDEVLLHKFSPTGFYSSAVKNNFLNNLVERSERQVLYSEIQTEEFTCSVKTPPRGREIFVRSCDYNSVIEWNRLGYTNFLKTPDKTVVLVTQEESYNINLDQKNCMGCLSQCSFSNWCQREGDTDRRPDPRSFCIQKTLQDISHGGSLSDNLMFAGHSAYRFGEDPFYENGTFIPTVSQLFSRILCGL